MASKYRIRTISFSASQFVDLKIEVHRTAEQNQKAGSGCKASYYEVGRISGLAPALADELKADLESIQIKEE